MESEEGLLMGPRPAGPEAPERPGRNHQEGAARIGRWRQGLGATQHLGTLCAVRSPFAGYKRLTAEVVESRLVPRSLSAVSEANRRDALEEWCLLPRRFAFDTAT